MCFVWIWEQTAIISLYNINWLVCITETESVYCAVRSGTSYIIQVMCFVWISEQTAIISVYSINWLVCITETDCVYSAVRTGSLNVILVNLTVWTVDAWYPSTKQCCIGSLALLCTEVSALTVALYAVYFPLLSSLNNSAALCSSVLTCCDVVWSRRILQVTCRPT